MGIKNKTNMDNEHTEYFIGVWPLLRYLRFSRRVMIAYAEIISRANSQAKKYLGHGIFGLRCSKTLMIILRGAMHVKDMLRIT